MNDKITITLSRQTLEQIDFALRMTTARYADREKSARTRGHPATEKGHRKMKERQLAAMNELREVLGDDVFLALGWQ